VVCFCGARKRKAPDGRDGSRALCSGECARRAATTRVRQRCSEDSHGLCATLDLGNVLAERERRRITAKIMRDIGRRNFIRSAAAGGFAPLVQRSLAAGRSQDWPHYGGDAEASRYSSLSE